MRKILLFITIILTLGFFIPSPTFAVVEICTGIECSPGTSEDIILQAIAVDEDLQILDGVDVTYTWEIIDPAIPAKLGVFTSSNGASCTGGEITNPAKCVEIENNSEAKSTINLKTASVAANGQIKVTAQYGDIIIQKIMSISTACKRLPALYYGIASVRVSSGVSSWQSSTAEVLETCRDEYKLYEGTGQGN
jgi:hypothetical protein